MKFVLAALMLVAVLGLTACGGSKTAGAVNDLRTNPQAQKDAQRVQKIVKACAVKSNMLSKSGRAKFYACIAPAGKQEAVKACAKNSAVKHNLLRKRGRGQFYADVERCILR